MFSFTCTVLICLAAASHQVVRGESSGRDERSDDPAPLEALVMQQAQTISKQQAKLDALEALVTKLQTRQGDYVFFYQTKVAFNVRLLEMNSQSFTGTQTLVFDRVDLNQGGDYDKDTGFFTAPVSGLYQFSLHILKNGGEIAEVEASGDDKYLDRSSNTVLVQLHAGDKIWVRRASGDATEIQGGFRTSFAGVLLVPDQP
ncbi:hypothetical protein BaRGS_00002167 [Batillaria attramentaria]|uniref:C1q domain-containing protein n=1 Tax=Batillaria attramentaria TaxID=370345 RepID=A0ABD0M589_9CAEN